MNASELALHALRHTPIKCSFDGGDRIGFIQKGLERFTIVVSVPHPTRGVPGRLHRWIELSASMMKALVQEKGTLRLTLPL